jgi:hypothetical protein
LDWYRNPLGEVWSEDQRYMILVIPRDDATNEPGSAAWFHRDRVGPWAFGAEVDTVTDAQSECVHHRENPGSPTR